MGVESKGCLRKGGSPFFCGGGKSLFLKISLFFEGIRLFPTSCKQERLKFLSLFFSSSFLTLYVATPGLQIAYSVWQKAFAWLALLSLLTVLLTNVLYRHFHVTSYGEVIIHAHPYLADEDPGTPVSNHSHSEVEILSLGQFANPIFLLAFLLVLSYLLVRLGNRPAEGFFSFFDKSAYSSSNPLRGPPTLP